MGAEGGANGWYFEKATITSTIGLVKELMAKYRVPVDRHYDYTVDWNLFKPQLTTTKLQLTKSNEEIAKEGYLSGGDLIAANKLKY